MVIKRRDPESGAIIYEQTPEEKRNEETRLKIKKLEKEILLLKSSNTQLFELVNKLAQKINIED